MSVFDWFAFSDGVVVATVSFGYYHGTVRDAAALILAHVAARNMNHLTGDRSLLHSVMTFFPGVVGVSACFSMQKALTLKTDWQFTMTNCMFWGASYVLVNHMQAFAFNSIFDFVVRCVTEERIDGLVGAVQNGIENRERKIRELARDLRVADFDKVHPAYCASLPYPETEENALRNFDCSVCLSSIDPKHLYRVLPRCRHAFHQECIDAWIAHRRVCPFCTTPMYDSSEDDPFIDQDEERDMGQELA